MAKASPPSVDAAVFFATKEIAAHPAIQSVTEPVVEDGWASVTGFLEVSMGARWVAQGGSPNGVYPVEEVRFRFPPAFPAHPVEVSFRADFSREHAHVQPWRTGDGRVVPCLVDGPLSEFLAARGVYALVEQTALWLEHASRNELNDLSQGWEPARRDGCPDILIADADKLAAMVTKTGGFKFFRIQYWAKRGGDLPDYFVGELEGEATAHGNIRSGPSRTNNAYELGEGLAVAVWAGKTARGKPKISNEYLPDDTGTAGELIERMKAWGTHPFLEGPLNLLTRRAASSGPPSTFPLVVINLVRRPANVLGTDSDIEICPYLVPLRIPTGALKDLADAVRPMAHRQAVTTNLLRRMSGDAEMASWALLGCGSLGSKIAIQAARSGNAPSLVADRAGMSPHNAARHGLLPLDLGFQVDWIGAKSDALASGLKGLGGTAKSLSGDHVDVAEELLALKGQAKPAWLINTTASMVAREYLARPEMAELPRIAEMALYNGGRLGWTGIEGVGHNPNMVELEASLYQRASSDPQLADVLFSPVGGAAPVSVGQGCASLTMVMSDSSLNVIAGAMGELVARLPAESDIGSMHLFRREGLGLSHDRQLVPPFQRVALQGLEGWTISVAADVSERIRADAASYPNTETGGVLVGWSSPIARQIVVTDLIAAPPDSRRSKTEFELGMEGLTAEFEALHTRSGGLLRCLGTWHSHLGRANPSTTDVISAALVGADDARPMAFLILGVDGYQAVCVRAKAVPIDQASAMRKNA